MAGKDDIRRKKFIGTSPLDMMIGDDSPEKTDTPKMLVIAESGDMAVGGYTLTSRGLVAGEGATRNDWEQIGTLLLRLEGAIQLLIGDWLCEGEWKYNETYQEIATETGYEEKTLRNYRWVAAGVEMSLRRDNLSYTHYSVVAPLDDDQKADLLERASAEGWSVKQLKEAKAELLRPTLSAGGGGIPFDFSEKKREIGKFGKRVKKARQDPAAKREALGWIAEQRKWLREVEEWLQDG
jgi:hypothetical protein